MQLKAPILLASLILLGATGPAQNLVANDDSSGVAANRAAYLSLTVNDIATAGARVEIIRAPLKGQVQLEPGRPFIYVPNRDALGSDSFTYRLVDGARKSNVATVRLSVRQSLHWVERRYIGGLEPALQLVLRINGPLLDSDTKVEMWSDLHWLKLPRFVSIPAGVEAYEYTHPIGVIGANPHGTLFYRLGSETYTVWLDAYFSGVRIGLFPSNAWAGAPLTAYVDVNVSEPKVISLRSNTRHVRVPETLTLQPGQPRHTFRLEIDEARWSYPFTIEAKYGERTWRRTFVTTPVEMTTEWVDPIRTGGTNALLKVTLNGKAGAQGLNVALRSNSEWAKPPLTAIMKDNNTTVWVAIPTLPTKITRNVTIWARFKGVERKAILTITP